MDSAIPAEACHGGRPLGGLFGCVGPDGWNSDDKVHGRFHHDAPRQLLLQKADEVVVQTREIDLGELQGCVTISVGRVRLVELELEEAIALGVFGDLEAPLPSRGYPSQLRRHFEAISRAFWCRPCRDDVLNVRLHESNQELARHIRGERL